MNRKKICQICGGNINLIGTVHYTKISDNIKGGGSYNQYIGCCDQCGFVSVLNVIDKTVKEKHYASGYDYTNYSSIEVEKDNYIERASKVKNLINSFGLEYDSVLDIGASTGYLLSLFEGKNVAGVETSDSGVYTAKKRYGLSLYHGDFTKFVKESEKQFDLVIMMHIMEHIEDLNAWMGDVKKVASKFVYVEVPCLYTNTVEPFGLFAEEHLNYFTPNTLNLLFENNGFECIHLSVDYMVNYRIANGFPMIRAIFKKGSKKYRVSELLTSKQYLGMYFDYSKKKAIEINERLKSIINENDKVAIWGASFQTERLLAESDYSWMNLECLLDNSDMRSKYSLFFNGRNIKVVKPDKGVLSKMDYIIISTYNNQKAIYDQISDMGFQDKAIILYQE